MPLHRAVMEKNPQLRPIYEAIQSYNERYPAVTEDNAQAESGEGEASAAEIEQEEV